MAHNLKRFLTLLFAAVVMVSLLATTAFAAEATDIVFDENPVCYTHGDANNDGKTTKDDAIYILYNSMWSEDYPITHKATADVDGNASVNTKDAIYTLYAVVLQDESHPLNENVHEYYTPFWSWGYEDVPVDPANPEGEKTPVLKAYLNIKCSCGTTISTQTIDPVKNAGGKAATCLTPGSYSYDATAEFTYTVMTEGVESTVKVEYSTAEMGATYIEELAPTGHKIGTPNCEKEAVCSNPGCDVDPETEGNQPYTLPALGHKWKLSKTTPATCQAAATEVYTCTYEEKTVSNGSNNSNGGNNSNSSNNSGKKNTCSATLTKTVGDKIDHTFAYVEDGDQLKAGTTCVYVKTYKCTTAGCNETTEGGEYSTHVYTAVMTKEATCSADGLKTFTCTKEGCGHSYTETVRAVADAHKWDAGSTNAETGITTYTCAHNSEHTKTAVSAQNVSKDTLSSVSELDLGNNATIKLDAATTNALPGNDVSVSITAADSTAKAQLQSQMGAEFNQIGGEIYNFNMTSGETSVTEFGGQVTISLPYTLTEGEDVNAIDVWFINDKGEVAILKGTYANGFVTFTTNHFSYYTVTRLTPAQRCAAYGHDIQISSKAATCTEDGYHKEICKRCGLAVKDETYEMLGHSYGEAVYSVATTCTVDGEYTKSCTNAGCDHSVEGVTPATGHKMSRDESRCTSATCTETGVNVSICKNTDCDYVLTEDVKPLGHLWNEDTAVIHYVTCTTPGYTEFTCKRCDATVQDNKQDPSGHAYIDEGWTWSEDHSVATLKIVCKNDHAHDQIIKGVITATSSEASCVTAGVTTYTATAFFNNNEYTESKQVNTGKTGHTPEGGWTITENQHSRTCSVCQSKFDVGTHDWNSGTVITEATCTQSGSVEYACTTCGKTKTEVRPATGIHNLVNNKCTSCGYEVNTCDHTHLRAKTLDLTGLDLCPGVEIKLQACECGQNGMIYSFSGCDETLSESQFEKTLADGTVVYGMKYTCSACSISIELGEYAKIDTDTCSAAYTSRLYIAAGDQTLADLTYIYDTVSHPLAVYKEEDISDKGLCDGTLLITEACFCGEVNNQYIDPFSGCHFGISMSDRTCATCGAVLSVNETSSKVGCDNHITEEYTVTKNGQVLVSTVTKYTMGEHLYGDPVVELTASKNCDDGVAVHHDCVNCDYSYTEYFGGHQPVYMTRTNLANEGYASCDLFLIHSKCACGQEDYYHTEGAGIQHLWNWLNGSLDQQIAQCYQCGITMQIDFTYGEPDEDCRRSVVTKYTFTDVNGKTYGYTQNEGVRPVHDTEEVATLKGDSCLDGLTISMVCKDCGIIENTWEHTEPWHYSPMGEQYVLEGSCGTTLFKNTCICGLETNFGYSMDESKCNFQWVGGSEFTNIQKCTGCGITWTETRERLEDVDSCHYKQQITSVFEKDGKELVNVSYLTLAQEHRDIAVLTLAEGATDCTGGFTVSLTCLDCDYTESYTDNGMNMGEHHNSYPIVREFCRNQLCGDLEVVTYSCACGKERNSQEYWTRGECTWQHISDKSSVDKTTGAETYAWTQTCTVCGATKQETLTQTPAGDENNSCRANYDQSVTYLTRTGKKAISFNSHYTGEWHRNITHQFNLQDPSQGCDGGYTVTTVCTAPKCGYSWMDSQVYTGCQNHFAVSSVTILENDGICGDFVLESNTCACGKDRSTYIMSRCNWENGYWDEDKNCSVMTCSNCGLVEYYYDQQVKNPNACSAELTFGRKYVLNGVELQFNENYTTKHTITAHNYAYTFKLDGNTCEEGFTVSNECKDCGYKGGSWKESNHWVYPVDVKDLGAYGACGGEVGTYRCACGKESFLGQGNMICDFNWYYDDAAQEGYSVCSKCGIRQYYEETGTLDTSNCTFTGKQIQRYVDKNGVEILAVEQKFETIRHEFMAISAQLVTPGTSCEEGVTITRKCKNCPETQTEQNTWHESIDALYVDLSDGCGGELRVGRCACGEQVYFHHGYKCASMNHSYHSETVDGIHHNYSTYTCPDPNCALVIKTDNYTVEDAANCRNIRYEDITIEYKGQTYTAQNSWYDAVHDYEYLSGTLREGNTSCEQGVDVNWTCTRCKATGVYQDYRDHALLKIGSVDLSTYGAICEGSKLNQYKCVCGAKQAYDFDGATKCDLDFQSIDHFITGVIDTKFPDREEGQHTTAGWMVTDSVSYIIKCGVNNDLTSGTSQICPLTIRMSECWLIDTSSTNKCEAVEYQIWQLGYNPDDGTYANEIKIPTGEHHSYHNYVWSNSTDILQADGTYLNVHGNTCTVCGSEDMNYITMDANKVETKRVWERTNKANHYEPQRITNTDNYGFFANNFYYATSSREEIVESDGSVTWNENTYSNYKFEADACWRDFSRTHSNPNWQPETGTESACHIRPYETVTYPTFCIEPGNRNVQHRCQVCNKLHSEENERIEPGHTWVWNETKNLYVCSKCDLENVNNASGNIVLEDMTKADETVYTVGYYVKDNQPFNLYFYVLFDGKDVELSNQAGFDIQYLESPRRLTFNKTAAIAAAEAALGDYTGSYELRITFYPVGGDGELDYSLTFDALTKGANQ